MARSELCFARGLDTDEGREAILILDAIALRQEQTHRSILFARQMGRQRVGIGNANRCQAYFERFEDSAGRRATGDIRSRADETVRRQRVTREDVDRVTLGAGLESDQSVEIFFEEEKP